MFLDSRAIAAVFFGVCVMVTGCTGNIGGNAGSNDGDTPADRTAIESSKSRVKFKEQGRFVRDLASGLDLALGDVCNELGLYDCYEQAHRITLGGVEPYRRGIRKPLPVAPVTAPIAVDRVALSACATRVDRDFDDPANALMFGDLAERGANEDTLGTAAGHIYDRLLRRDATVAEVDELVSFYDEAVELLEGSPNDPTREWAVTSCFAVATTMEGLFY